LFETALRQACLLDKKKTLNHRQKKLQMLPKSHNFASIKMGSACACNRFLDEYHGRPYYLYQGLDFSCGVTRPVQALLLDSISIDGDDPVKPEIFWFCHVKKNIVYITFKGPLQGEACDKNRNQGFRIPTSTERMIKANIISAILSRKLTTHPCQV
jgi:hypothetical protein